MFVKGIFIVCIGLSVFAAGCAGNREMLSTAVGASEGMGRAAKAEGIESPATADGDRDLALAKQLSESGKTSEAYDAAILSGLEYRLAFAEEEARRAALADSTASRELRGDEESQKFYQGILDGELKNREAAE